MTDKVAIIDVGTGYTKMGVAPNSTPQYVIPSVIGIRDQKLSSTITKKTGLEELDFLIGDEAVSNSKAYPSEKFMSHGIVSNWDHMEKFYEQCFYKYLRLNPEDYNVMLTEPPLNSPENREYLAEVMFETFNVKGMYIAVQAVLAICATWLSKNQTSQKLTGTVVDSGDGVTHIIPVSDGAVIPSAIKHIPIAGSDFTKFILEMIRDREPALPSDEAMQIARNIKEKYCYVSNHMVREYEKWDSNPQDYFKKYEGVHSVTKKPYSIDIGYERFLAPEIFFNPEIYSTQHTTPLPVLVDTAIQASPVDCRRALYSNIVLSGGSTLFKHFDKRLQKDITSIVTKRLAEHERKSGVAPTPIETKVISHHFQRNAVYFGGSILAQSGQFASLVHTKAQYDEYGPSICRVSPTFSSLM
ncbi:actin-related protein 3 [Monocercomonoides exilis]|uniref:actin-related protein 3 n=1 Tax=Monocercomonoides exilis TaxID=2049356 RepID=UPI0035598335|nr:actin-related protein 3 [Monocercomonoides exilis]|eukprot:MONOS_4701.1-p1 / transcript=MONOS_4701.1 / gene=MONOS_4701 / organism=Monocercomonoides_exilis_PA203 / gene_product=actin-related protein 3 / transcript_product=actin-related protein 3 / location=Mono_scaffold00128:19573-21335(-) / protein_length=412 / sequence_SO=supercontig / SO=protein_coding / is_pseudo=false